MGEGSKAYEMKKLLVFVLMFGVVLTSNGQRKKAATSNTDGGAVAEAAVGIVGAIALAAYYEYQMREMVEQSAMEWALANKEYSHGDKLEMKLISWEIKAVTDISATRNLLFKFKRNNEPYEVIIFILSEGWWNSYGVEFSKVQPIEMDKNLWSDILYSLVDIACVDEGIQLIGKDRVSVTGKFTLSDIFQVEIQGREEAKFVSDFSSIHRINGNKIVFAIIYENRRYEYKADLVKIKGDEHIIGVLENEGLVLDYNEKRINLFNKSTRDLIKLNIFAVNEINRLLLPKPLFVDKR